MARFGRDLFVDRHRNLAGGAHPLDCECGVPKVGGRSLLGAESRLGTESSSVLGGVRGHGGEGDCGNDTE
jgi:hypothetical protein